MDVNNDGFFEKQNEPDKYAMDIECTKCGVKQSGVLTVHTTPPQRKPLTDEEIIDHFKASVDTGSLLSFADGVRYAEAAHGIKEES